MNKQIIDMHNTITALSGALDLVGVDEIRHGRRVGMMARTIALYLNWEQEQCLSILYAGMLHDCGVSKIREHRCLTETLEWDGAEQHCILGAQYLQACPLLAHFATEIRYHHTRWEKLLTLPITPQQRIRANLLFLADRIDVLQAPYLGSESILTEFPGIIQRINTLEGTLFAPELVVAFSEIAKSEAFWLKMEAEYLDEDIREIGLSVEPIELDNNTLKELARMFSWVVDAKSPFTDDHSQCVAHIVKQLAIDFGVSGDELEQIEIAGLLHDLGKLRVSEAILDKPGSLTPIERASMHRHSYDTFRILNRVFAESKIPYWAGFHHETLSGEGYPFRTIDHDLDLECRIIAVADIFQALAQNRPYRVQMSLEDILENLNQRVEMGSLDRSVVARLTENAESYYELAIQKNSAQ